MCQVSRARACLWYLHAARSIGQKQCGHETGLRRDRCRAVAIAVARRRIVVGWPACVANSWANSTLCYGTCVSMVRRAPSRDEQSDIARRFFYTIRFTVASDLPESTYRPPRRLRWPPCSDSIHSSCGSLPPVEKFCRVRLTRPSRQSRRRAIGSKSCDLFRT